MPASPEIPVAKRRWYHPIALAKRLVIYAVIAYVVVCVYLAAMQTRLIYVASTHPMSIEDATRFAQDAGVIPWDHSTAGSASPQGFVRPDFATAPAPRGTIVCFHGNGEFAWMRTALVDAFRQRGFRTFLYEYPGFGGRPGTPSEKAIVPDAQALIRSLDQAGFGPVYVCGISLGAGVAAAACADPALPVRGLILITPWDNLANVGLTIYPYIPVRLLLVDRYDSIANLQNFPHPICVVRSEKDELVLPRLSLNLYDHLPVRKKMIVQPDVGHNDWPASPELKWWDEALDFIAPK
jgi:pimeloyl-ACP methyl ester carboxylesterase